MTVAERLPRGALVIEASVREFTRIKAAEFALAIPLAIDGVQLGSVSASPSQLSGAALVVLGLVRRSTVGARRAHVAIGLLAVALTYAALTSYVAPDNGHASDWVRRLIRIAFVIALAYQLATGRVHLGSVLKGMAIGLVVNIVAFQAHLTPDRYGGALTGWVGDKNKAAMFYSVVALLLLSQINSRALRVTVAALGAVPVFMTLSRTSITAYALGLAWAWVVARRPQAVRAMAAGLTAWLVVLLETQYAHVGLFANRIGSDILRARIDAAATGKVLSTPFEGRGLGEAYVYIGSNRWLFHNSYDTLRVEGGWVYFLVVLSVTVFVGLRPLQAQASSYQDMVVQGACLALLICAWKLGEVFLTMPWALIVGGGLNSMGRRRSTLSASPDDGLVEGQDVTRDTPERAATRGRQALAATL